jgi:hypothetical protein
MNWMYQAPKPPPGRGSQRARMNDFLDPGPRLSDRNPLASYGPERNPSPSRAASAAERLQVWTVTGPMGGSTGPDDQARRPQLAAEGIQHAIKTLYYRA